MKFMSNVREGFVTSTVQCTWQRKKLKRPPPTVFGYSPHTHSWIASPLPYRIPTIGPPPCSPYTYSRMAFPVPPYRTPSSSNTHSRTAPPPAHRISTVGWRFLLLYRTHSSSLTPTVGRVSRSAYRNPAGQPLVLMHKQRIWARQLGNGWTAKRTTQSVDSGGEVEHGVVGDGGGRRAVYGVREEQRGQQTAQGTALNVAKNEEKKEENLLK